MKRLGQGNSEKKIEKLCLIRRSFITLNETEDKDKKMQTNL